MRFDPSHGGYPGEIIVGDEYLECVACRWCYPLDQGDDECGECGGELAVKRANPAPVSTLRLL
jgi:hypothetical protein